jgi:hypothetical protein
MMPSRVLTALGMCLKMVPATFYNKDVKHTLLSYLPIYLYIYIYMYIQKNSPSSSKLLLRAKRWFYYSHASSLYGHQHREVCKIPVVSYHSFDRLMM